MLTKGIKIAFLVMVLGLVFTLIYPKIPGLAYGINAILSPTLGTLLNWNVSLGMIIITGGIALILVLVQKYTVDQDSLRQLKKEQKLLQEEAKKYRDNPQKLLEINKQQLQFLPRTMDLTMAPVIYTAIPLLVFFRWFSDYFAANPAKVFGILGWFWAYLIFSVIFSMIFRKVFDMP